MTYLGTLGRMVHIKCPSSLSTSHGDRYTLTPTVEGGMRAQVRPVSARQWQIGWGDLSTPADLAVLQDFARGAWGTGPWWFLPPDALNANILTPRQAALIEREQREELATGGPVVVSDGSIAPTSVLVNPALVQSIPLVRRLPVKPGGPMSFTAEVEGDGAVAPEIWIAFYDDSGANIRGHFGVGTATPGMQRVSVTNIVPENAHYAAVGPRVQTMRLARPQVTWSDVSPPVFSDGRGCNSAVVHGLSEGLVLTSPTRTFMNAGFTVSEVT